MSSSSSVTPQRRCCIRRTRWGTLEGKDVWLYTLSNSRSMSVEITNYGGIVKSIVTPDCHGIHGNIVLGFDSLAQYAEYNTPYMGAIIGRYANRIAQARFPLGQRLCVLAPNDSPNHLHGGVRGFDKVVWDSSAVRGDDAVGVALHYLSEDGQEGYPGNLEVKVTYLLTGENELSISYEAHTDQPTVLNLTHHSYFNLSAGKEDILNHQLTLYSDYYTPTDDAWIPTGRIAAVAGTDMDFICPRSIGERISHLKWGYNVNYILRKESDGAFCRAAIVRDPVSGRALEVFTTEPGLQLYTGDFLDGTLTGSGQVVLGKHMGLCLEAQHFPDAPNHPGFPSTLLRPGEIYTQRTVYQFLF